MLRRPFALIPESGISDNYVDITEKALLEKLDSSLLVNSTGKGLEDRKSQAQVLFGRSVRWFSRREVLVLLNVRANP